MTAAPKLKRVAMARRLKKKGLRYLGKMVWWDYTSLGVGRATADEKVWAEKGSRKPALRSTKYTKAAKHVAKALK